MQLSEPPKLPTGQWRCRVAHDPSPTTCARTDRLLPAMYALVWPEPFLSTACGAGGTFKSIWAICYSIGDHGGGSPEPYSTA